MSGQQQAALLREAHRLVDHYRDLLQDAEGEAVASSACDAFLADTKQADGQADDGGDVTA